jgi:hypothetical protein
MAAPPPSPPPPRDDDDDPDDFRRRREETRAFVSYILDGADAACVPSNSSSSSSSSSTSSEVSSLASFARARGLVSSATRRRAWPLLCGITPASVVDAKAFERAAERGDDVTREGKRARLAEVLRGAVGAHDWESAPHHARYYQGLHDVAGVLLLVLRRVPSRHRSSHQTGPHTTASARWTRFLKDLRTSRRLSVSNPDPMTPFNSTPDAPFN